MAPRSSDAGGSFSAWRATGVPPICRRMTFDVGPFALRGTIPDANDGMGGFCPRRTVLDALLRECGGRVRRGGSRGLHRRRTARSPTTPSSAFEATEGHEADRGACPDRHRRRWCELLRRSNRASAGVRRSACRRVCLLLVLQRRHDRTTSSCTSGSTRLWWRADQRWSPSRDGELAGQGLSDASALTSKVTSGGRSRRRQISLARVREGRREEKWYGTAGVPGYFRKPYGKGWALVGDASYNRDPITAQGISDAFIDAEMLDDGAGDVALRRGYVRRATGGTRIGAE